MSKIYENIDVICAHKADGSIIPIRIRFMTDDGEYQTFNIKGYREAEKRGARTTEDGIFVCDSGFIFECMIYVFNTKRVVRLYYDPKTNTNWKMAI
ncbi:MULTISPECIES: hypothetical protein [unclassified Butyrivibrio]|jgi:hypothetical protein|uniref:hypothetical protein n=1 Tax=unclassified Butyrivibrio TaxID=2639466 RepID=UPI0004164B95|nr:MULTISPECIES: hypothetical protein [unclassified Butyrivibrio]MCR5342095.1 hypothetical protein [Butyrivibrio sp.]